MAGWIKRVMVTSSVRGLSSPVKADNRPRKRSRREIALGCASGSGSGRGLVMVICSLRASILAARSRKLPRVCPCRMGMTVFFSVAIPSVISKEGYSVRWLSRGATQSPQAICRPSNTKPMEMISWV